jgi:hypothetical protein
MKNTLSNATKLFNAMQFFNEADTGRKHLFCKQFLVVQRRASLLRIITLLTFRHRSNEFD